MMLKKQGWGRMHGLGQGTYEKSLYPPLNFVLNQKLLCFFFFKSLKNKRTAIISDLRKVMVTLTFNIYLLNLSGTFDIQPLC